MALFNQSLKAVSSVVLEIADSAGASGDSEMTTRAGRSLQAAIQHFNTRANWDFVLTENAPIKVFAPFGVSGTTASANQTSAVTVAGHGFLVGDILGGNFFQAGTRVTATATGSIGFSRAVTSSVIGTATATADITATRDLYDLPSDYKAEYAIRLIDGQRVLLPVRRRLAARSQSNPDVVSTPSRYDIYYAGASGKIRLINPPANADALQVFYYRRMTVPTTSATAAALDVPQDYEQYIIAWAKWHFLTDKGDKERAQTWMELAKEGLAMMLADQTRRPDEDLMFFPGHYQYSPADNPNSTVGLFDRME